MTVKELKNKLEELIEKGKEDYIITIFRKGEKEVNIVEVDENVNYMTIYSEHKLGNTVLLLDN